MIAVNNWATIIQDWLYPPTCLLCGDPGDQSLDLCHACHADLPYNHHACPSCGAMLAQQVSTSTPCGHCLRAPPNYDTTQALLCYQAAVPYLITSLKFAGHYPVARLLGALMAHHLKKRTPYPQQIIPVPLHHRRYQQRGFNQAIEIARPIAHTLEIPLNLTSCRRHRNTSPQSRLAAKERRHNLKGAFSVIKEPGVEHVAIIDDVVSTGTTVNELARALRRAGVKRIDVWSAARAVRS